VYFNALKCVFTGALCKAFTEGTYSSSSLLLEIRTRLTDVACSLRSFILSRSAHAPNNSSNLKQYFRSRLLTIARKFSFPIYKSILFNQFLIFGSMNLFYLGPGAAVAWSKIYALKGSSKFLSLRGSRALSARWGPKKSPTHPCIAFLTSS
jgi:hypothetical protein